MPASFGYHVKIVVRSSMPRLDLRAILGLREISEIKF